MIGAGASARWLAVAVAAIAALIAATLVVGSPEPLPSVALGAVWLLHVERVVAAALAISAIATLALRSAHGQLPLKFGATSIEFESLKATTNTGIDSLEELELQVRMLWDYINEQKDRD
jgi:uncharacterized membrane protein YedE/YeeE